MGGTLSCAGDKRGQYAEDRIPYGAPMVKPVEDGTTIKEVQTGTTEITGTKLYFFSLSIGC